MAATRPYWPSEALKGVFGMETAKKVLQAVSVALRRPRRPLHFCLDCRHEDSNAERFLWHHCPGLPQSNVKLMERR